MTSKNYYISPFLLNLILALSVWTSPALAGPIVLVAGSTLSNTGAYLSVVELPEPNGEDGGLSKAPQEIAFFPGIASAGVNQSVAVGTDPVTGHKKAFVLAKLVQPGPLVYRIDSYNISTLTQESSITLPAGDSFENLAISPDKARLLTINQQTAQAYFLDIDYNNFSQSTITVKDLFYFGASILSGTKMTFAPDGTALILEGNVLLSGTIIQNSVATEISPDMSTVTSWQPVWGGPNMRGIATDIELYTAPGTQLALASIRAYDASQPTTTSQGGILTWLYGSGASFSPLGSAQRFGPITVDPPNNTICAAASPNQVMRGVPCIFNYPSLTLTPGLTTAPDNDYRDIQFLAAGDLLVAMNAAPDSGGIPNIKRGIEVYRANEPGYPPFGRKFRIHDRDMLWSQTANSSNFELLALPNDSVNWVVYIQSRGPSVPSLNVKSVAVLHIDSQAPVSGSIRKKGDVTGVQNVYDIEFVLGL